MQNVESYLKMTKAIVIASQLHSIRQIRAAYLKVPSISDEEFLFFQDCFLSSPTVGAQWS